MGAIRDLFKYIVKEAYEPTTTKEQAAANRKALKEVYTKEIPDFYKEQGKKISSAVRDFSEYFTEGVEKGAQAQNEETAKALQKGASTAKQLGGIYKDIFTVHMS